MNLRHTAIRLAMMATVLHATPLARAEEKGTDWQLIGGIGALGAGVVFLGLGYYQGTRVSDSQNDPAFTDYRKRFDRTVTDACAEARAGHAGSPPATSDQISSVVTTCDQADSRGRWQKIFYVTGGVFVAGGIVLLVTRRSSETKTASIQLVPAAGPDGGGLLMLGRF